MDEMTVTHYGLHWDMNGVAYLHQGRSSYNFLGLRQRSPFLVKPHKSQPCNHMINPAAPIPDPVHWRGFLKIASDPVMQAMFPIPKQSDDAVIYINDAAGALTTKLILLGKMTTPIQHLVRPLQMVKPQWVRDQLEITNVQPLVLVGANAKQQKLINDLVSLNQFSPRRLILVGNPDVVCGSGLSRSTTGLFDQDVEDLANLPFDLIGAMLLRRHARHEEVLAPLGEK